VNRPLGASYSDLNLRVHYYDLITQGFTVWQGYDQLFMEDFVAAYHCGQQVDLHRMRLNGTFVIYRDVNIGGF
jgi:hypothetical protein